MLECNRLIAKKMTIPLRFLALLIPIVCIVLLLSQTAFAKNTYLINDRGRVVLHTTYATDPAVVLDEIGVQLGEDDTYTTQPGLGVSEITIQRKQVIAVSYNGITLEVISYGETVDQLLNRLQMVLTGEDIVSVPLNSQTFDGMNISVSRSMQAEESYVAELPYETTYYYDANLPKGVERILTAGMAGQVLRKETVSYLDGKEISRSMLSEDVVVQPVNAVIAVGTAEIEITDKDALPDNLIRPQFTGKPYIGDGYIITPDGERLTYTGVGEFKATAYHNSDPGCTEYNYIGTLCRVGAIAVDTSVIPHGTRMYIVSNDGKYVYGIATAEDCGSSIKGMRIDLYFDTVAECDEFGIRNCQVYFLG